MFPIRTSAFFIYNTVLLQKKICAIKNISLSLIEYLTEIQLKTIKHYFTIMNKTIFKGAYDAPVLRSLNVRCEEGFSQSVTIDGLTPMDGVWDEEASTGAL